MIEFETYGPFDVPRPSERVGQWRAKFWREIEEEYEYDLGACIGCYAFLTAWGKKHTPWYVGKAVSIGFSEVFTPHKLYVLSQIAGISSGRVVLALFPLMTPKGAFSQAVGTALPQINWIEKILIGMALSANPSAFNLKDTNFHKNVKVNGVFGKRTKGRPEEAVRTIGRAFKGN